MLSGNWIFKDICTGLQNLPNDVNEEWAFFLVQRVAFTLYIKKGDRQEDLEINSENYTFIRHQKVYTVCLPY